MQNNMELDSSMNDPAYQQRLKDTLQEIQNAFKKIDKNGDDLIDKEELTKFLDNMSDGKKFDRTILKNVFDALDIDKNGSVSVNEFAGTYVKIQEELKIIINELKANIQFDSIELTKYEKLVADNKNERLNKNNVCLNAKLIIELLDINSDAIGDIVLKMKDVTKKSTGKNTRNQSFHPIFEFTFESRDEVFKFELYNLNSMLFGKYEIPLAKIENQEEYILDLEIFDNSHNAIVLTIKLLMIWSYYKMYQDKYNETQKNLMEDKSKLDKRIHVLENLIDPFKFINHMGNNYSRNIHNSSTPGYSNQYASLEDKAENQIAHHVESIVKSVFNSQNIQWVRWIKIFSLSNLLLSYLSLFTKPDFINLIVSFYLVFILLTTYNSDVLKNLQRFIFSLIGCLVYDIFWFILSPNYKNDPESAMKSFVSFISILGLLNKILLLGSVVVEKTHFKGKKKNNSLLSTNI